MLDLAPFPWTDGAEARDRWHAETAASISRQVAKVYAERHPGFGYQPGDFVEAIRTLELDHSEATAAELYELARHLTPGGAHDCGLLIDIVRRVMPFASPDLILAALYQSWKGGKMGFQFLPNPASLPIEGYADEANMLMLDLEHYALAERVLIDDGEAGRDRSFYDNLPETFTAYRGCHGISAEQAALGVCWTTRREIAEWFAWRGSSWMAGVRGEGGGRPVVVSARVRKSMVRLAFASEHEVVLQPARFRELKVRRVKGRPPMTWTLTARRAGIRAESG